MLIHYRVSGQTGNQRMHDRIMIDAVLDHVRFHSALAPDALRAMLEDIVEPTPWPPPLIFKLSGGGIVSRVMASPKTQLPFFGVVSAERIRIARATRGGQVTPYQPILLATIEPESGGSLLALTLRPHRETRSLSGLFTLAGFVLIGAALPAVFSGAPQGLIAVVVGVVFMVFPTWRARTCFRSDTANTLAALRAALPITDA